MVIPYDWCLVKKRAKVIFYYLALFLDFFNIISKIYIIYFVTLEFKIIFIVSRLWSWRHSWSSVGMVVFHVLEMVALVLVVYVEILLLIFYLVLISLSNLLIKDYLVFFVYFLPHLLVLSFVQHYS